MREVNEGRVCDAVIRELERQYEVSRQELLPRDNDPAADMRVDATFVLGDRLFALEHTVVEPFEGFLKLNSEAPIFVEQLVSAISARLPLEARNFAFELSIPALALQGKAAGDLDRWAKTLTEWSVSAAEQLLQRTYARRDPQTWEVSSTVPFMVRLRRYPGLLGIPFQLVHHVSDDVEVRRRLRMARVRKDKFPKLYRWKERRGARTILVLEENDFQLTNHWLVEAAFLDVAGSGPAVPDETYLVSTGTPTWFLWPILVNGRNLTDLSEAEWPVHRTIDPTTLSDATSKALPIRRQGQGSARQRSK